MNCGVPAAGIAHFRRSVYTNFCAVADHEDFRLAGSVGLAGIEEKRWALWN